MLSGFDIPDGEVSKQTRMVSEVDWKKLQEEIKKSRFRMADSCPLCADSEAKVKKFENEFRESEKKAKKLEGALSRQIEELERESQYRKTTEADWKKTAEEFDCKIKTLQLSLEKAQKKYSSVVAWSKKIYQTMEDKLRLLTVHRQEAQNELTRYFVKTILLPTDLKYSFSDYKMKTIT